MVKKKVLYVMHNHPVVYPGGAEAYAYELYEALRGSDEIEPLLVARIGSGPSMQRGSHPGAPFSAVTPDDPNQYFLYTDWESYDWFKMTSRNKRLYSTYLTDFLRVHKPDVVHFQHMHFIGYDAVSHTRRVLPDVPIVFTLHEYLSICHRDGQMLRTHRRALQVRLPPPLQRVLPGHPAAGLLPARAVRQVPHAARGHVPGAEPVPAGALRRLGHSARPASASRTTGACPSSAPRSPEREPGAPRNRLGFFGQFNHYKGVDILLEAMRVAERARRPTCTCGCTAPTSSCSRPSSSRSSPTCSTRASERPAT